MRKNSITKTKPNMKNFLKNWKTTSAGILAIVGAVVSIAFAPVVTPVIITAAATGLLTGIGLIFAKDGNVTGGTNPATPEAKDRVAGDETP